MKIKVVTVVGTRPEIIRLSSIIKKFDKVFEHTLIHTGQNYDFELSEIFFKDLDLRQPDFQLECAGKNATQTIGNIFIKLDQIIENLNPDACFILGDTNSCLSSLVFKKRKIPIFHYEAGNRCFDKNVPEELNRILVDNISDINLTYSKLSKDNLIKENFSQDKVIHIGSPMFEVIMSQKNKLLKNNVLKKYNLKKDSYIIVSTHREENVDNPKNFKSIVDTVNWLLKNYKKKIILNCHPRILNKINSTTNLNHKNLIISKPFGYIDYLVLQKESFLTISDSGTISEESSILNFRAINIRNTHERPEAMEEASVVMSSLNFEHIKKNYKIYN